MMKLQWQLQPCWKKESEGINEGGGVFGVGGHDEVVVVVVAFGVENLIWLPDEKVTSKKVQQKKYY